MSKQTFRIGNNLIPRILFCFSSLVLVLFGILAIVSPVESNTNALVETTEYGTDLSVATNSTVDAAIRPKANGSLLVVKDTLVANSNLQYGYEVYVSANSDTSSDIYLNGNTANSESNQKISATTGTYAAPTALNLTNGATWGYAIAGLDNFDATYDEENPSNSAKFAAMPTIGNEQLIHDVSTTVADDEINVYYGVKMDSALEPGIYKTEILYTIIPRTTRPCNGICYDANGGTGTMNTQSATSGDDIVLEAPNYSRDGYGFVGWNTAEDGTGTMYGPNETVTVPARNGLYLYAQWLAPEQNVTFQTFDQTDSTYANAATGTVIALEDERDGQVYTVAKLADGNWWMTENLRLNFEDANTNITKDNTNRPTDAFVTAVANKPASSSTWCKTNNTACVDQIVYNANSFRYEYGSYYNYYTVAAGNGSYTAPIGAASGDICPAGWHVPTSRRASDNGDFGNLINLLGGYQDGNGIAQTMNDNTTPTGAEMSNILRSYPFNAVMAGRYDGDAFTSGISEYATTMSESGNYSSFRLTDSWVAPGELSVMYYAKSVRCLANTSTTYTLSYDANSGSGAPAAQSNTNTHRGYTFTISNTEPTLSGYEFYGWDTDQNATAATYLPGDTIAITTNTTLYAIWGEPRTAKAILGDNGNLNFVYDANTYTEGDTYTDNIGQTEITRVYTSLFYISDNTIRTANFDNTFRAYKPTTTRSMFDGCSGLTTITHPENLDTSNVTDMSSMFRDAGSDAQSDFYLDLTSWNVGNVENMQSMFYQSGVTARNVNWTLILDNWDVRKVKYMGNMFAHTGRYADTWNLSVENWDLTSLEQGTWMFYYAGGAVTNWSLDLSSWNVRGALAFDGGGSSSSNGSRLFDCAGTSSYSWSLNLSGWDTSDMTNVRGLFNGAGSGATVSWSLNLSGWDTSNFTTLENAFESLGKYAKTWSMNVDGWDVSSVTSMKYAFAWAGEKATSFTFSDLSSWDVSNVTNMNSAFYNMGYEADSWTLGNLGYIDEDHTGWNVGSVTDMSYMFGYAGYKATTWFIGDISGWDVSNVGGNYAYFVVLNENSTNASVVNNQPGGWT